MPEEIASEETVLPDEGAVAEAPAAEVTEAAVETTLATGAEAVKAPVTSTFPDNWREIVAGDDPKAVKTLERMASPDALWKSYSEARKELDGGKRVKIPDASSSEEEYTNFNKALGVPDEASGYIDNLVLESGRVLGDEDRPMFDYFSERMHQAGTPPKIMATLTDAYLDFQHAQSEDQQQADHDNRVSNEIALKEELGGSFTSVTNAIGTMFSQAPPEISDLLTNGRASDGTLLGDHPTIVKWLGDLTTQLYPAAAMQAADGDNMQAMDDEIASLKKLSANDSSEYWTGPNAQRNQERYGDLLDMRNRARERAA